MNVAALFDPLTIHREEEVRATRQKRRHYSARCTNGARDRDALYGTMLGRAYATYRECERMAMIINQPQRRCCGALSAQPASVVITARRAVCVVQRLRALLSSCRVPTERYERPLNTSTLCRARSLPLVARTTTRLTRTIPHARHWRERACRVLGSVYRTAFTISGPLRIVRHLFISKDSPLFQLSPLYTFE